MKPKELAARLRKRHSTPFGHSAKLLLLWELFEHFDVMVETLPLAKKPRYGSAGRFHGGREMLSAYLSFLGGLKKNIPKTLIARLMKKHDSRFRSVISDCLVE